MYEDLFAGSARRVARPATVVRPDPDPPEFVEVLPQRTSQAGTPGGSRYRAAPRRAPIYRGVPGKPGNIAPRADAVPGLPPQPSVVPGLPYGVMPGTKDSFGGNAIPGIGGFSIGGWSGIGGGSPDITMPNIRPPVANLPPVKTAGFGLPSIPFGKILEGVFPWGTAAAGVGAGAADVAKNTFDIAGMLPMLLMVSMMKGND